MKLHFKFILAVLVVTTILTSCDEYLKTESPSVFSEESSFSNLDFAKKAVNGIYDNFTSYALYGGYANSYNCDNDVEVLFQTNNGGFVNVAHYAGNDGISYYSIWWNLFYSSIERANICIDNLPKSAIWTGEFSEQAKQLYGEALTLRAWCYYELINLWGDVPFKTKSTQAGDNFYTPKTDRDEIYEYLINDLKDAQDYVQWLSKTKDTKRINKGFVKGLRARMALAYAGYSLRNRTFETKRGRKWQEHYIIANQECKELIESGEHNLNPSFENVFKILHGYSEDLANKEILYQVAMGRNNSGGVGYYIGMFFGYNPMSAKYGRSSPFVYTTPYYYYSFDRQDVRRSTSVELYQYGTANYLDVQRPTSNLGVDLRLCKWRKSWITPSMGGDSKVIQWTGIDWPLMRYSDVVLMFAETENEINGGPTPAAKYALSLIRKRAFLEVDWPSKVDHYVDSVSTSKDNFFNAIVNERAWELGGEMIRKNDLVRWNLLGTKIKQMLEENMKIFNNDPKYASIVPDYLFWRTKADGETIEILNPDYRLPSTMIDGYTRSSWFPLITTGGRVWMNTCYGAIANGYNASKNNHLHPINASIISSYNGAISNDQIP
ncbi:MAG: RagB/SusD family nutrient uptake outer membrane protein [Mangrovibacterium sp.]